MTPYKYAIYLAGKRSRRIRQWYNNKTHTWLWGIRTMVKDALIYRPDVRAIAEEDPWWRD